MKSQSNILLIQFTLTVLGLLSGTSWAQTINLFSLNDDAQTVTQFYGGMPSFIEDRWSGAVNLGVTGTTSGSSSLPNPGLGSSASGSFFADHNFNALSWDLNGSTLGTFNAGLGNAGSSFPTIANTTLLGGNLSFFIDTPFTLNLTTLVSNQFTGSGYDTSASGARVALFAQVLDGVLVNQYLGNWYAGFGAASLNGGTYTGSFNQGVFRLEFDSTAVLSSNIPNAFGTQFSSYDVLMSVTPPVPEPSGVLMIGVAACWGLRRRRVRPLATTTPH